MDFVQVSITSSYVFNWKVVFNFSQSHTYEKKRSFFFIILETQKTATLSFTKSAQLLHSLANRRKSIKIVPKYFFNSLFLCYLCSPHAVLCELSWGGQQVEELFACFPICLLSSFSVSFLLQISHTHPVVVAGRLWWKFNLLCW